MNLINLVQMGSWSRVREALRAGANPNERGPEGKTPLMFATANGHLNIARTLIFYGARINDLDATGSSALMLAASEQHPRLFAYLSNLVHPKEVKRVSKKYPLTDRSQDGSEADHHAALMTAVAEGHNDDVINHIESDTDIDRSNPQGSTPLYIASVAGQTEVVQTLIDAGARIEARARDRGRTPLLGAAAGGHTAVVRILLGAKANVRAKDIDGRTALLLAADARDSESVRILIQAGADVSVTDNGHVSATLLAAENGDEEIVRLLEDAGAVMDQNLFGRALIGASSNGDIEQVRRLVIAGADPNACILSQTPLTAAASRGHLNVVCALIEMGADVNLPTKGRYTALIKAASHGHLSIARKLVESGADIRASVDIREPSDAITFAQGSHHAEIVRYLREILRSTR